MDAAPPEKEHPKGNPMPSHGLTEPLLRYLEARGILLTIEAQEALGHVVRVLMFLGLAGAAVFIGWLLLAGVAAKEAVLSTMGTAYSIGEVDPEETESLGQRLASDPGWSKTTALALMLFVLIYSPCFVTLVVLKNEAGGWRWLFFSMVFNTGLAYGVAYIGTLVGRVLWG